jgi:putative ABC transport system permease protein
LTSNIGTRYFETAGVRLAEGRDFTPADREGTALVAIVNESFARRFWQGASAIGRTIRFVTDKEQRQIVGVAADTKFTTLTENPRGAVFIPLRQEYIPQLTLLVQTGGDPRPLLGAIRTEVQALERNLPLGNAMAVEEAVARSMWAQRLIAGLLAVFGGLALLLAAIGVYGLTAYAVTQRTNEIGIRLALGAQPREVMWTIVMQGMVLVVPGLLIGLGAALASSRIASSLLFGIGAAHPPTYLISAVLLALVAGLACLVPAMRAAKVDPLIALRHE